MFVSIWMCIVDVCWSILRIYLRDVSEYLINYELFDEVFKYTVFDLFLFIVVI